MIPYSSQLTIQVSVLHKDSSVNLLLTLVLKTEYLSTFIYIEETVDLGTVCSLNSLDVVTIIHPGLCWYIKTELLTVS